MVRLILFGQPENPLCWLFNSSSGCVVCCSVSVCMSFVCVISCSRQLVHYSTCFIKGPSKRKAEQTLSQAYFTPGNSCSYSPRVVRNGSVANICCCLFLIVPDLQVQVPPLIDSGSGQGEPHPDRDAGPAFPWADRKPSLPL